MKVSFSLIIMLCIGFSLKAQERFNLKKDTAFQDNIINYQLSKDDSIEAVNSKRKQPILFQFPISKDIVRRKYMDLTNRSSFISSLSSIAIVSTSDETDVTANINLSRKNDNFNLSISTPVSKKMAEAINLDGLAKKTNISIGWSHDFWQAAKVSYKTKDLIAVFGKLDSDRISKCCKPSPDITDYTLLTDDEKKIFQQLMEYKLMLPFIGLRGKLAKNSYDYFTDSAKQNSLSATKYDFEITTFGGLKITNHKSLGISLQYQRYYDAGNLNTYTIAQANNVGKEVDLYEMPPTVFYKLNVLLEYRYVNKSATLAFNPYILTDFKKRQMELKAQFYFFKKKDEDGNFKGLNGGAFVGYRTNEDFNFALDKNNLLIGVFFAPVFDLNKY